jgi:hypothetical protein
MVYGSRPIWCIDSDTALPSLAGARYSATRSTSSRVVVARNVLARPSLKERLCALRDGGRLGRSSSISNIRLALEARA